MSTYLQNFLSSTTTRYNSIRRTLLSGDEVDGDTEDDTHVTRVLRAYYIEKGRPFPPWLPPDPKAPQQAPASYVSSANVGAGYRAGAGQPSLAQSGSRGGGLSDLWDPQPQTAAPQQESLSLRRSGQGARGSGRRPGVPEPQHQQVAAVQQPQRTESPPPSSGSAQERLKARLWGGSSGSLNSRVSSESARPSPAPGSSMPPPPGRNPYERSQSGGDIRQGGGYDNRNPYGASSGGAYGGSSTSVGREQKPYMSASSPWVSGDQDYNSGYSNPSSGGPYGRRTPQGPRPR